MKERGSRKGRSRYDVSSCRGPRRTHARQSAGLPRLRTAPGPGCAICSPGLVRSGRLLSPACFPSAAAWTAARPARAPAAPRCVGCAGGQRVPSARLRRGVCGPRARSARPALPRGLPLSPPAAPAAPWRPPRGEPALAHPSTPGEEGPLGTWGRDIHQERQKRGRLSGQRLEGRRGVIRELRGGAGCPGPSMGG